MSKDEVRVRVSPSPTGEPHVGTAWIALFNLAFARKHGGKLVLRIEDTDQERSRPEWEREIMNGLRWLGLSWDEGPDVGGPYGPYRQSERRAIHQEHANLLVEKGHAYRCFCTKERLEELRETQRREKGALGYDGKCRSLDAGEVSKCLAEDRPFTIRMKMPKAGETVIQDRLRGEVRIPNENVDDQVLLKSDGFPTYHLANVVDDHLMRITHVIRAEEWISSTPKHVVLYEMFGWTPPTFVHLPLLRNQDTSKISKRKNPVSILDYRQRGFLPEAVLNFLGLLGWSMPDGREIFTLDEFIEAFSLDRVSLTGPVFDLEKLKWLNGKYFREKLSVDDLTQLIREQVLSEDYVRKIIPLVRERIDVAEQFIASTDYFFRGDVDFDVDLLVPKDRSPKDVRALLEAYTERVEAEVDFSPTMLEGAARTVAESLGWRTQDFFMILRVSATGRTASPPLFDTMSVLGRALVRRRLRAAMARLKDAKPPRRAPQSGAKASPSVPEVGPEASTSRAPSVSGAAAEGVSSGLRQEQVQEKAHEKTDEKAEEKLALKAERRRLVEALRKEGSREGAATVLEIGLEVLDERIALFRIKPVEWSKAS